MREKMITLEISHEHFKWMDHIHKHFGINKSTQARIVFDNVIKNEVDLIRHLKEAFSDKLESELERIIELETKTKQVLNEQTIS
jgi:hypothetical protein